MQQEVDALCEGVARHPLGCQSGQIDAERRLVVGDVGEGATVFAQAIADGGSGVGDGLGQEPTATDLLLFVRDVVESHLRGNVGQLDREERRGEVAGDALLQGADGRGWAPDVEIRLGDPQGCEEPQPLEVIEVKMGEKEVDRSRPVRA